MNLKAKALCSVFLTAAVGLAGCSTPALQAPPAPAPEGPVTLFKNDFMNKAIHLIVENSIVNPKHEDLAKAAIAGVRRELGANYAGYSDDQIRAVIDDPSDTQREQIIEAALSAALGSISPHDIYMSGKSVKDAFAGFSRIRGIGAHLIGDPATGGLMIEEVAEYGPALRAGLRAGDVITAVDDVAINGDIMRGVDMIRGEDGTRVNLTVARMGEAVPRIVSIERGAFMFKPVLHKLIDDVAYIRLRDFKSRKAGELIKEAVDDMREARGGRPLKGYILDLRGNPGGLVMEAAEIADHFIDSEDGISLHVKGKKVSYDEKLTPGDILGGAPLVVLINDESASASELLAGALQDHKRAIIIGTQSYGKGSVQTTTYLSMVDKSRDDAVRVTSGLYFLPSGASIQGYGITPDVLVKNVAPVRNEHERDMKNAIPNPTEALAKARQTSESCTVNAGLKGNAVPETLRELRGLPDKTLLCAYDYLRRTTMYSQTQTVPPRTLARQP